MFHICFALTVYSVSIFTIIYQKTKNKRKVLLLKKAIIIGSGPAGISAALYLQRSGKVEVTVISSGAGALEKAEKIENYYGFAEPLTGKQLYENGIKGAQRLGVKIIEEEVVDLTFDMDMKPVVGTDKGEYHADAVLIATGASRKTLKIKGIQEHEGKGVSYCAVCDAFFYRNKKVCVIGSGEYALHEAQVLAQTSESVTILTNGNKLTADVPANISVIEKKLVSVDGENTVESVTFDDGESQPFSGVFIALGVAGSSELARKVGAETENGRIKVNEKMETSIPGLYAAGDCTGGTLQVFKAVYEGSTAALAMLKNFQ